MLRKVIGDILNVFIFIPYYFNVQLHLRHLFLPWKRIVGIKKTKGFSSEVVFENISMTIVSTAIGFFLRSTAILLYVICLILFCFIGAPLWFFTALVLWPFAFVWALIDKKDSKEQHAKDHFLQEHMLDTANKNQVEAWYEEVKKAYVKKGDFFSLENLLSIPAIGRDWSYGFTPKIDDYATELTSVLSYRSELLDRAQEIAQIEQSLSKSMEANILLVGEEGVGKHTIIDGLAQHIYEGKIDAQLQHMRIIELNMEKVLANAQSREEKITLLEELLDEACMARNIIILISDFHKYCTDKLIGDYSQVWERYGKEPLLHFIAITTPFYFEHIIFHNEKVNKLFSRVTIEEVSRDKATFILREKAVLLEKLHKVTIPYETILHTIDRSSFYVTHIPYPEKAINLLDEACAYVKQSKKDKVFAADLDHILSVKIHAPVGTLTPEFRNKLLRLPEYLSKYILGQGRVLEAVARTFRRAFVDENRIKPKASFLFLGPTGVGKTATAKALAALFFGNKEHLIRLDMSFYQNEESLPDLIGSFEKGTSGLLAQFIRERPYSVLLIDEIEKAHKEVLNIFLTLLDEGYLVDGYGKKIDGKNLIVIATSNAGSADIQRLFYEGKRDYELEKAVRDTVIEKGLFTPELLNRFDKTLIFEPINKDTAYLIGFGVLERLIAKYKKEKNIDIVITPVELTSWIDNTFDPRQGAREVERIVAEQVAEKVSYIFLAR